MFQDIRTQINSTTSHLQDAETQINEAQQYLSSDESGSVSKSIDDRKNRAGDQLSQIASIMIVLQAELEKKAHIRSTLADLRAHLDELDPTALKQPLSPETSWEDNEERVLTLQSYLPDVENKMHELQAIPVTEAFEAEISALKAEYSSLLAFLKVRNVQCLRSHYLRHQHGSFRSIWPSYPRSLMLNAMPNTCAMTFKSESHKLRLNTRLTTNLSVLIRRFKQISIAYLQKFRFYQTGKKSNGLVSWTI